MPSATGVAATANVVWDAVESKTEGATLDVPSGQVASSVKPPGAIVVN